MNRKQRRAFNKSMKGQMSAEEIEELNQSMNQIASLGKCNSCNSILDKKNNHHLDTWTISVIDEKMILICDKCQ